jgi:hypothetical protein
MKRDMDLPFKIQVPLAVADAAEGGDGRKAA